MEILNRVKKDIINNKLILKGEKVLVALSGGSDSVAMLHILNSLKDEIGFSLCAAHLNHCIRKEADLDEEFVKNLCKKLDIDCYTKKADILKVSKETSKSSELCGREARYEFFEELKIKYSIDKIATAHNKNDSAESILLHLIRGAGLDGLSGIPMLRNSYIIRPVLSLTKAEIEEYCNENDLSYVVDKTNFEKTYTRNKVRLELIPYIEKELNEGFIDTIISNADVFKEISSFLENTCEKAYNEIVKDTRVYIKDLFLYDTAVYKRIIQKMYKQISGNSQNLSNKYINNIIDIVKDAKEPKAIYLPNKILARCEQGFLRFEKNCNEKNDYEYSVVIDEELEIKECGYKVIVKKENELGKNTKNKIYFYVDNEDALIIRNRRAGDKFSPVGMKGTKNISDLFCDMKIIQDKRNKIPLLLSGNDIIWVMGIRADRRFEKGKNLLSAQILKGESTNEKEY